MIQSRKKVNRNNQNSRNDKSLFWSTFALTIIISFGTRFYKIDEPDHVCWDETHFGKMGTYYINRTFFFDVHPPLGKMLIGLAGKLTGYDGSFPFNKPGDKYGNLPYLGMRSFCATLGSLIIPFCFIIIWELTHSISASFLSASLVTFDIGLLTLSQYILLDPILMFFVVGAFMGSVKFNSFRKHSFSKIWWFWLVWTGTFLACAISVKFVGLFVVILVGLRTINELWILLGDVKLPLNTIIRHFLARVLGLIILPIVLYTFFFWIHLKVLYKSGTGDGFFSSAFQSQLEGNSLYNVSMPRYLAYGAKITLKNHRTGGGYLHSHWHLYPEGFGARQQQVTTYSHKDDNNNWIIKKYDQEPDGNSIEFVRNNDLIRLEHEVTTRNIHSHRERAPVTKKHYQVTCYGENGTGDANDVWKIQIVNGYQDQKVETVTSKLRFIHYLVGCALHSHSKQLPKWGYEQMEVTCNPNTLDKKTLWNVEDNHFSKLPNVSFKEYAPSFFSKFFESHAVMLQGNAGLKPKEGEVTSRPWQWPINYRGQFFSGNEYRVYLLGNPIIWWGNLVLLIIYLPTQMALLIMDKRGCQVAHYSVVRLCSNQVEDCESKYPCIWLLIGWALHYFPFFAMERILYFHHYFPAFIFSSLLSGIIIDYIIKLFVLFVTKTLNKLSLNQIERTKHITFHLIYGLIFSVIVHSFYLFCPLSYGIRSDLSKDDPSNSTMSTLKWLESWEF